MERKMRISHKRVEDVVDKMENFDRPCMDSEIHLWKYF